MRERIKTIRPHCHIFCLLKRNYTNELLFPTYPYIMATGLFGCFLLLEGGVRAWQI